MSTNATHVFLRTQTDITIVYGIFIFCVSASIILSSLIIFLIICTQTLHSPMYLLLFNNCLQTIVYVSISIMNTSLFYFEILMSDWWCRIQAYLNYATLNLVAYSYLIQAISRLFFVSFYRHRFLLTYKSHLILIAIQILISLTLPLPSLITQDITFRLSKLCLIPMKSIYHLAYFLITTYVILLIIFAIIYTKIYRQVIRPNLIRQQMRHAYKRDIQVMKNILIIYLIFMSAGVPGIIYTIISVTGKTVSSAFYLFVMGTAPVSTFVEKISVIYLNKEIRKAFRCFLGRLYTYGRSNQTTVVPFHSTTQSKCLYKQTYC